METEETVPTANFLSSKTTSIVLTACLEEVKGNDNTGYIIWPETESGASGTAPCPRPSFNTARRECVSSRWREPDIAACSLLSTRSQELQTWARAIVSAENASFVAEQIANITSQDQQELIAYDIINVGNILERIIAVLGTGIDSSVGIDVVASVSNVIDASVEEMRFAVTELNAADQLIRVVEDVSFLLDLGSENIKYIDSRNIKIAISEIDPANFTGQVFTLSEQLQFQVTEGAEELSVGTSISLPSSIMDNISANSSSVSRAQFAAYTKASLFNYTKVNSGILNGSRQNVNVLIYSDHIISASIGRVNFEDLAENVTISISHSNLYIGDGPHCVFWKPPTNGLDASWSSEGCHLVESTDSKTVCKCDHLTNFAFIMDVYGYTSAINDNQKEILRILSYIGCGLSLVGLSFTLISYALFEKLRKDIPSKLLMNLCISLILANIVFLCLQPSYHSSLTSCTAVAALMHYFLLTSLTWMGLEALNLYIAIVIVFKTYFRRYMLKMVIAGWGIPFIIVGISFIVQFGTGVPSYEINNVTEICWLRNELFYGTLVAPLGLVFLFNTIIYFLVLMQLLRKSSQKLVRKDRESRRNQTKPKKRENFRKLRGAVGLMALLGISWGLAFVMIDAAALTFAYLFVVFNSSQGFWVFIFQCVLKKEVSKSWRKLITSKGTQWKERSSRWSRFSSSNTRGSRSTTTTSARSHSAASIKTSYLVPRSSSAFKSEVSIGLDSNGVDVVTRSSGHLNPSFDNDIGNPPNFPPPDPPISISSRNEERVVRRVPRRTDTGLSTTIATQTDIQMTSSDTDSQGSLESLHNIQASGRENFVHHDAEEEERRDSVDEHFGAVRTHSSEAHRAVAMSPSNESGIYSDASVSSQTPQSHHEGHIYVEIATDNDTIDQESPSEGINENRVVAEYDDFNNTQNLQRYEIRESTVNEENDNVNGPTTDSGISVSSDNLIRDRRHEYQSQDSTSSLYSISSMTSGPSSGSEVSNVSEKVPSDPTSLEQTPIPHLWRPPLVIKRSDDLAKASTSQNFQFQRKPVVTGGSHGNKKKNGRKSPKSRASQTRKKSKRRSSDRDNGSKDGSNTQQLDVKMTNFSLNRGSFHDGKS